MEIFFPELVVQEKATCSFGIQRLFPCAAKEIIGEIAKRVESDSFFMMSNVEMRGGRSRRRREPQAPACGRPSRLQG